MPSYRLRGRSAVELVQAWLPRRRIRAPLCWRPVLESQPLRSFAVAYQQSRLRPVLWRRLWRLKILRWFFGFRSCSALTGQTTFDGSPTLRQRTAGIAKKKTACVDSIPRRSADLLLHGSGDRGRSSVGAILCSVFALRELFSANKFSRAQDALRQRPPWSR